MENTRETYCVFYPITTRWGDNDIYGHINNVTYYSYFDSAVNRYLIEKGNLDINGSSVVGYVVKSQCQYLSPIAYPEEIEVGIRVDSLGNSSVAYGVAIFRLGEDNPVALGDFVHVFVDKKTGQSTSMPTPIRNALELIVV